MALEESVPKGFLGPWLAVDKDHFAEHSAIARGLREGEQVVAVGVGGEAVQHDDLRAKLALDAEDSNPWTALDEATTERVLRLKTYDDHDVFASSTVARR